jgi:paraquat-inducible protein B
LSGGIAFETADAARQGEPSKEGTVFPLYNDRQQAQDASYTREVRAIVEFDGSVRGLDVGAPVEFRGIKVGRVLDFHLEGDPATMTFRIPVTIAIEVDRIRVAGGSQGQFGSGTRLPALVARGLRAQLRSGNLITGQLVVALDIFPDAPPEQIVQTDTYPKLPTVPNDLEGITRSVSQTLDKISELPLDEVVKDLRKILKSVLVLTDSPDLQQALKSLNRTLAATEPLAASLRRTSESADATLKQADTALASMNVGYGRDSKVRSDLSDLLRQLQDTARSVRLLASYLEQHPEALVRGKAGGAQ